MTRKREKEESEEEFEDEEEEEDEEEDDEDEERPKSSKMKLQEPQEVIKLVTEQQLVNAKLDHIISILELAFAMKRKDKK